MKFFFRYLNRYDRILLFFLLTISVLAYVIMFFCEMNDGSTVVIIVDGKEYGTYSLSTDQTIPVRIDGAILNTVQIEGGNAYMIQASCPDHLCIRQGAIHSHAQSIVCLPNHVVVTVEGADKDGEMDSMVR